MPIVNRALVKSGFSNIKSVVTTFDSGGDTGRMRTDERGRVLAFSDYWRSLISLWKDGSQKDNWEEMLRFRDGRNRNFGNMFFQFMTEKVGKLSDVDRLFSQLTGARIEGEVIPVSSFPADVCFETISGKKYRGEHYLDELRMSDDVVVKIWLEPKVEANQEALRALVDSEVIILCPGSMYGSVMTNFLPNGMAEAYNKSRAKKILMTNIMSAANENNNYTQKEYVETFERYLKSKHPFDLVVVADLVKLDQTKLGKALKYYAMEHSGPIGVNSGNAGYVTLLEDLAVIEETNMRLRHSEDKMSRLFKRIL